MPTLLTLHDNHGVVGRCDARCYNAKRKRCTCICDGHNHGVGLAVALAHSRTISINDNHLADRLTRGPSGRKLTPSKLVIEPSQRNFIDQADVAGGAALGDNQLTITSIQKLIEHFPRTFIE